MSQSQKVTDVINVIELEFSKPILSDDSSKNLQAVRSIIPHLDDNEKELIIKHFLHSTVPQDRIFALWLYLFDVFREGRFIEKVCEAAQKITSPAEFSELFWNVFNRLFTAEKEVVADITPLREVFSNISSNFRQFLSNRGYGQRKQINKIKKIAIISPQILGMRHSPTREAYSLACHLTAYFDCKVYVFNTNALNYVNNLGIEQPMMGNYNKDLGGIQISLTDYLEFKSMPLTIVTSQPGLNSSKKFLDIITTIEELEIDAVIAHGENLLLQDALYGVIPSIFATTGEPLPFARSDSYWIPGNLMTDKIKQTAEQYGHKNFLLESMLVTPEGKADQALDRKLFNIPDKAFIYLVVGTRLNQEINNEFSEVCKKLLSQDHNSVIAFAGTNDFNLSLFFDDELIQNKRVINVGFQDNLPELCLMSNVYLNPQRSGGGTSSQTAIMNGLPVVTLDYGHISSVVPESHRFSDWNSYYEYARKLAVESAFLTQEIQMFFEHFSSNLQVKEQVSKIYQQLCKTAEEFYQ